MFPSEKICVIGLGYVGLPLALALAKHYDVLGVEINDDRLSELKDSYDRSGAVSSTQLKATDRLLYFSSIADASAASCFIVTVPTPVFNDDRPNLQLLEKATTDVGNILKKGDMVVFESTVCPGTTDDFCLPILQRQSSLRVNVDFDCAYSPERISPNDKGLSDAVKIVSASNPTALQRVSAIYQKVASAGIYPVASIKIAEAAKLTENIQRDVDIAITNELAMTYTRMGIDSTAVFDAAATKWNFRRFYPGLVGGHCIGTDSYYLLDWAKKNQQTAILLQAARDVNNTVPHFVADQVTRLLQQHGKDAKSATVLLLGFSFKENCTDVRNTLVAPLRQHLIKAGCHVRVCDPVADAERAEADYHLILETDVNAALADKATVVVFAVAHRQFTDIPIAALTDMLVVDVKGIAARSDWRL